MIKKFNFSQEQLSNNPEIRLFNKQTINQPIFSSSISSSEFILTQKLTYGRYYWSIDMDGLERKIYGSILIIEQ